LLAPSPALRALRAYLVVAAIPVLVATTRGAPIWIAAVHASSLVVVWWLLRAARRVPMSSWWELTPLVALPLLYAELGPVIATLHGAMRDPAILALESMIFGTPSRTLAMQLPDRVVSELLHAGYLSYYPLIYGPPLVYLLRRQNASLRESVLALTLAYALCFVAFMIFPVEGPRYRWGPAEAAPEGPVRDLARRLLRSGSSRGTAFPSSHVAVSVAQAIIAMRRAPRWGWIVALCAVGVAIGAVYGGFHYAIDVLAGVVLGVLCAITAIVTIRSLA
jgi:membrane-associated phospholipid phosphatase